MEDLEKNNLGDTVEYTPSSAEKNISSEESGFYEEADFEAEAEVDAEISDTSEHPLSEENFMTEDAEEEEEETEEEVETASPKAIQRNRTQKSAPPRKKAKRRRKKRRMWPLPLIWTTLVVSVSILLSMVIIALGRDMYAIGKISDDQIVDIPMGSTSADISEMLVKKGIIRFPRLYLLMAKLSGADASYIAGEHILSPDMAYETIIDTLCKPALSNQESVNITFTEGMNLYEAATLLEEKGVCEASRFLYFFNLTDYGYSFMDKLSEPSSLQFYRMEGYLFPDTYTFNVPMEPQLVVQKIYQNFNQKITEEHFARMDELNMTLDEVITLASIVQAEAPSIDSMQKVASVFYNRLNNRSMFPKLQSDPTKKYVREVIKPNISIANQEMYNAYDTYEGAGLPPGAICNPGMDAIEAVLYPADTDYYYFNANIYTKKIFYARTLEEHNQNLATVESQYANMEVSGE